MSYLALYRKYRPIDFDEVYGQEEIVTVIKNAIINNKISHAYLFSGPRGTGKTTIAKIIARLVNCDELKDGKPCGKCYNCLNFSSSNDIVEIDAASNNGVDEIRELRDKINLVPSNAKYKVYIIDEVHMLTTQAFNALLKTLEEPPSHVIFILATTEPHKIPLTIASRCQKFKFSKIDDENIVKRLKGICDLEDIKCDNDALYEIARISDGCMRDAINLLDQLVAYSNGNIVIEDVYSVNGTIGYDQINEFLTIIKENNKVKIIEFVDNFSKIGNEINKFLEELIIYLKDIILFKNANIVSNIVAKSDAIKNISDTYENSELYLLIEELNKIQNSIRTSFKGSILFLVSILSYADRINNKKEEKYIVEEETKEDNKIISQEIILGNNFDSVVTTSEEKKNIDIEGRINNTFATASKDVLKEFKNSWNKINDYLLDDEYSNLAGILIDSDVVAASYEYLIISNKLDSIVSRINDSFEEIQKFLVKVLDYDVTIVAITDEEWNKKKKEYVKNIKSGTKYEKKELNEKKEENKKNSPVDELIDLVGTSVIEYK